jgi:hypothetical protein
MQFASQEVLVNRRTAESLREHACNAATKLRDGIARVVEKHGQDDGDASSQLISLCGNLDQLDSVVRRTIGMHPHPVPPDLVGLHARLGTCVDAAMDLASWAFDPNGSEFARSATAALAQVRNLLAFVDPTGNRRRSVPPPPMYSFRSRAGLPT